MPNKKCNFCGLEKDLSEFHLSKRSHDGRISKCKKCVSDYDRLRYNPLEELRYNLTRRGRINKLSSDRRKLTSDQILQKKLDRRLVIEAISNAKKEAAAVLKSERKLAASLKKTEHQKQVAERKAYRASQKEIVKSRQRKVAAEKYFFQYHNDPLFKLKELLKKRADKVFKRNNWSRDKRSHELLGADFQIVKYHIESQFKPGMSWLNHGEWHIDHKIPLDSSTNKEDVYKLFHYTNLQPLWAADNISKSNKISSI